MHITTTVANGVAIALALVLTGVGIAGLRRPIVVKLGLRNIPRRPAQSLLIVLGLTLSTVIIVSALSIGDTLSNSIQRHAVEAYGQIDQVIAPAFLSDLVALVDEDTVAEDSQTLQLLDRLAQGDLASVFTLLEDGLPGIPMERYTALRTLAAEEPLIDGVAASIVFPTIVRNVNTGQGEPLGFIFAVDGAYDADFGLHSVDGRPVRMAELQPGVGNIFVAAADLFTAVQGVVRQAGTTLGVEDLGVLQAATAVAAVGALLTAEEGPTLTLRELQLDVATLRNLGFDTSRLEERGIQVLSLESLGLGDEELARLGIDPDAPITLPTLQTLGLDLPDPATATANLLGGINLNTLGRDLDQVLARYGLQLRQGEVYLNRLGAQQLDARPGDLLEIFIGPIPVPYRVRAIVEESGPLGALTPVVMMDVAEAQRLLFMPGRVNAILVSNQGDQLAGVQHTDAVNERLRAFSLNETQLHRVEAILQRDEVAALIRREAPSAQNPVVEADEAPRFLQDLLEGIFGVQGFQEQVQALAAALAAEAPGREAALRAALANSAVRAWLLDLPLPRDAAAELRSAFQELDDFLVLTPLSKQFALQGADIAGLAFGSMFTVFGAFSILAGVLLIFLIFVMLAAERRSELGIARAVGMQRGHLVQMFVSEGLAYDLAAALVGLGLGLLVSYAMVGFLGGLFQVIGQQLDQQALSFRLYWSVAPPSLVIAYCGGVLLTFGVVTIASWRVSRLNIVAAIRGLPDTGANGPTRLALLGRTLSGPGLLLLGAFVLLRWWEQGQTVVLVGLSLLLVGGCLAVGWLLEGTRLRARVRERLVYSAMGLGLLACWAIPWATLGDTQSVLFRQNPAFLLLSFILSGPLVIAGAILVVMFNADSLAGLGVRWLGGLGPLAPVLKTAIAYPLHHRFRTGVAMLLFAMVITTVTVMSVVIRATEIVSTPDVRSTAGFDIELSPGLLSFFKPVTDLAAEMAARPDFPRELVAEAGAVARLSVEARQQTPQPGDWRPVGLTGVDGGYARQAAGVYPFLARAAEYPDDAAVWAALATRDDVAVVAPWRVEGAFAPGEEAEFEGRRGFFRLQGFTVAEGSSLPPVTIQVRTVAGAAVVTRTLQVIGVLAPGETLAEGSIQVNRAVLDALNGEPVQPERFYIRVTPGVDVAEAARALERAMLNSGFNATSLAERFAAGQAIVRGILRLFQGFLALGLVVGIAGLGVITSRTVVERRQQVGVLRAIGYQRSTVALLFVLEASFIALTGLAVGAVTGVVLGDKMFGQFYTLATDRLFPMPWLQIGGMLALAYFASLLAAILPAWQASRIFPAEALRYE
ncbi:MAG: hypothetical protein KatS3mg050_1415 [Litorilinea sp.]|nr:MAG: hypothetical protein KatS3mg050_1415 [Litorilinea sp.]